MPASRVPEPRLPGSRAGTEVVVQAHALLGAVLHGHGVAVRITEVEAYAGPDDPASHAFTRTARSEIMYGPAGRLYLYRSYGIHWCANVVTGEAGQAGAVLLRAGAVVAGTELATERRAGAHGHRLARGPGNLAAALGLTPADLGVDLDAGPGPGPGTTPWLERRRGALDAVVRSGPRVGVSRAADRPWRFWLEGEPSVSAYRRSPRA